MDVIECIRTRRSIRKYLDKEVEWDKVGQILDAGRAAPSAGNLQNWRFIVVKEEDIRKALAEASFNQFWMQDAKIHIVVCSLPQIAKQYYGSRGEILYSSQNCGAAIENMLLAAHSLGLGACWVGAFDEDKVRAILGIPDDVRPEAILTLGYGDERVPLPPRYKLYDITYINSWASRIEDFGITIDEWSTAKNLLSLERDLKEGKKLIDKHGKRLIESVKAKSKLIKKKLKKKLGKRSSNKKG